MANRTVYPTPTPTHVVLSAGLVLGLLTVIPAERSEVQAALASRNSPEYERIGALEATTKEQLARLVQI